MNVDKKLFWDVDFETIDWNQSADWIIVRIIERGDVDDIRLCMKYYGDERVRQALLNAKYILKHRLHLAAVIINEPVEKFRCYTLMQSNPALYPY